MEQIWRVLSFAWVLSLLFQPYPHTAADFGDAKLTGSIITSSEGNSWNMPLILWLLLLFHISGFRFPYLESYFLKGSVWNAEFYLNIEFVALFVWNVFSDCLLHCIQRNNNTTARQCPFIAPLTCQGEVTIGRLHLVFFWIYMFIALHFFFFFCEDFYACFSPKTLNWAFEKKKHKTELSKSSIFFSAYLLDRRRHEW